VAKIPSYRRKHSKLAHGGLNGEVVDEAFSVHDSGDIESALWLSLGTLAINLTFFL